MVPTTPATTTPTPNVADAGDANTAKAADSSDDANTDVGNSRIVSIAGDAGVSLGGCANDCDSHQH
jgi:hypothetical protein